MREKNNRTFQCILASVSLLYLLLPQTARANFFDGLGAGARPMGLGSAYTAVSDDLYSIYYNIAGLDQIGDNMLQFGYIWANPSVHFESSNPGYTDVHKFPYSLNGPLISFGLDMDKMFARPMPVHVKFGMVSAIPDNFECVYYAWDPPETTTRFYRLGDYWQQVHMYGGLSLSTDYLPWVSVGVGFQFIITGTSSMQPLPYGPGGGIVINGIPKEGKVVQGANMFLDVNTLITPNCGIMFYPLDGLRLGYSYRGATALTVDPVTANATILVVGDLGLSLTIPLKMDVYFTPQTHNWGVSYKWANKVLVALDLSWQRFSQYTSIARGDPVPTWNDSWIPRIGVEYYPVPIVALRAGYFFEPAPIPEQVATSNFLDNDRHVWSAGFGVALQDPFSILLKPLDFNLAVQYTWMPERSTVKDPALGGSPDSYETWGNIIAVAGDITIRF